MTDVLFVETRQIRRNHKTVQWRAGETYPFEPEMQPMIDIGHARIVDDVAAAEPAPPRPKKEPAKEPADKPDGAAK